MKCAECQDKKCYQGRNCSPLRDEILEQFASTDGDKALLQASARIEAEHYMKLTRLEETILFVKTMGYKRIGLAFCLGLSEEARRVAEIFSDRDIEVVSACCKVCGIDKSEFDMPKINKENAPESTCNPTGQAIILNKSNVEFSIMMGLCVGHDSLFLKACASPTTVLVVKDRVLGHNPVAALYTRYYTKKIDAEKTSK